jgi:hypothetical protein
MRLVSALGGTLTLDLVPWGHVRADGRRSVRKQWRLDGRIISERRALLVAMEAEDPQAMLVQRPQDREAVRRHHRDVVLQYIAGKRLLSSWRQSAQYLLTTGYADDLGIVSIACDRARERSL